MPLLKIVEARHTPSAVYNWRIYLLAAVASLTSFMIGYDSAFIGTTIALPSFEDEFGWKEKSISEVNTIKANIVSLYLAGAFFGSFLAHPVGHFFGRKIGLICSAVVFTFGAGIMLGTNAQRGLGMLYAGRVIAGIAVGAGSNLTPIYISELAPPAIRGRLVGIYEFGWQTGGLLGFWINYAVSRTLAPSRKQWLIPFAVQIIPSGLMMFGALFLRESPRWLLSRGRREHAIQNLVWARQLDQQDIYIVEELGAMDQELEELRSTIGVGFLRPFKAAAKSRTVQWRLFLGSMLFFWQNGCGINAINYYSPTVFASLGLSGTNSTLMSTGLFGCVKTALMLIWLLFLIDHAGRRTLFLVGSAGGSVCLWIVGAYLKARPPSEEEGVLTSGGIAIICIFFLWTVFFTPAWGGTPWVINSEMFDTNMRSLAQACAAGSNWFWTFMVSRFTPQMFTTMGYGVYFFFASLMLCSIFFVFFLIPETKGIPLESMGELFKTQPVWRAHATVLESLRASHEEIRNNLKALGTEKESTYVRGGHISHVEDVEGPKERKLSAFAEPSNQS